MAVRKGKQIAAALEALIHAMGFNGGRQRQPKRKRTQQNSKSLQCYNCQQLRHTARECKNAVACLKCAAARSLVGWPAAARTAAGHTRPTHAAAATSGSHAACPPHHVLRRLRAPRLPPRRPGTGEGCEPRRHRPSYGRLPSRLCGRKGRTKGGARSCASPAPAAA
ncbi:uncharacterized protein LOC126297902 [Schistocerca gregaria]|uniref:uncharacterized protein LOC126297902 n=1 Tax=Schistocerca gregaria TaxID=7010 RepID=UPI00211DE527|nr:uncharacterized protein LOC126297902 [Schistocerca gregaria]